MEGKLKTYLTTLHRSQQIVLMLAAVFVILNALLLIFILLPERDRLEDAKQSAEQSQLSLELERQAQATEFVSEQQIQALQARIHLERTDSELLTILTELASNTGTYIELISQTALNKDASNVSDAAEQSGIKKINLSVTVAGNLPNLSSYFEQLSNHDRLFAIQEWSFREGDLNMPNLMSYPDIDQEKQLLKLQLNVTAYIFSSYVKSLR